MVRRWWITLATAACTALVLLVPVFLLVREDDAKPAAQVGPGPLDPIAPGAPQVPENAPRPAAGPEGVPLLEGPALGPAAPPAAGETRGGIRCGSTEQLAYHVHARLSLFVNGKPRSVPLGIGIGKPVKVTRTDGGEFASGGSCFALLHTHAANGVIHIEAPERRTFTLGQFFDVWRQQLGPRRLGRHSGNVTAFVDGKRFRGNPRRILLRKHAQIQIEVGQPIVAPRLIEFPEGL